jgi:protein-S-isoprenylcysteine O-methyltransferase Ste14
MVIGGYFGTQDAIILILCTAMAFSILRRNPDDPTRWIPLTRISALRWATGVVLIGLSLFTSHRTSSLTDYVISSTGTALFVAGAVFFYGAKSPMSSILVEDDEYGVSLRPGGLYRVVRHPLFFCLFLCSIGLPVYIISPIGLIFSLVAAFPLLIYSSRQVDAHWASRAGSDYVPYSSTIHMFIPSFRNRWKSVKRI